MRWFTYFSEILPSVNECAGEFTRCGVLVEGQEAVLRRNSKLWPYAGPLAILTSAPVFFLLLFPGKMVLGCVKSWLDLSQRESQQAVFLQGFC